MVKMTIETVVSLVLEYGQEKGLLVWFHSKCFDAFSVSIPDVCVLNTQHMIQLKGEAHL